MDEGIDISIAELDYLSKNIQCERSIKNKLEEIMVFYYKTSECESIKDAMRSTLTTKSEKFTQRTKMGKTKIISCHRVQSESFLQYVLQIRADADYSKLIKVSKNG